MARAPALVCVLAALVSCLTGCASHKQARIEVPQPPPIAAAKVPADTPTQPAGGGKEGTPSDGTAREEETFPPIPAGAKPISIENGLASWYGAPYHNRRGSNGEVYNMHAMTAAHRTLPLGSIVRVTNVKTGHVALVRITDRGPFVPGRIIDLSLAAAQMLDVWQPGIANVKVEVMQTPAPLETGGRWAVQIGSFGEQDKADALANHLSRRYHSAKILAFAGPTGDWWLRVRVLNDDRQRAEDLAHATETSEGAVFLVRLD
jgi:rare lipoprotein A